MAARGKSEELEATEEVAPEASTETTEAPAEVEVDLTGFIAAAEGAIVSGDFEEVNAKYNELDRKGKTKASKYVNDQVRDALVPPGNKDDAFAWGTLGQALRNVKPVKVVVEKPPVNRTEGVVNQLAVLHLAYTTALGNVNADGLDEDWKEQIQAKVGSIASQVQTLLDYRKASTDEERAAIDVSEIDPIVEKAVKLATTGSSTPRAARTGGTSGPTYNGPRRSIPGHIAEAFAAHPSGKFLTISEIRSFVSTEYGTDLPSAGAISAALKSAKWDASAIVPGVGGEKGTFGATKK